MNSRRKSGSIIDFCGRNDQVNAKSGKIEMTSEEKDDDVVIVEGPKKPKRYDESPVICKVCMERKVDLILYPCSHACICQECYDQLPIPKACPVCRTFVTKRVFVILE